jgi:hypothetical protein
MLLGPRWSNIRYRGSAASKRLGNTGIYNRLTDGGKVVSPTHRPSFTPRTYYFSAYGTHFCWRLSEPQILARLEGLDKLEKLIHLIGSRARDLPACSTVLQSLSYRVTQPIRMLKNIVWPEVVSKNVMWSISSACPYKCTAASSRTGDPYLQSCPNTFVLVLQLKANHSVAHVGKT